MAEKLNSRRLQFIENLNERLKEDFHNQDSSRNIFSNLDSTSNGKRVHGRKQPSIDVSIIKKTVGKEKGNNQPVENIDG